MDETLEKAAERCRQQGIDLVLENEHECNTATASEAVRILGAVSGLNLNWDPANAVMAGEMDAYPAGWSMLPKERIHHCHMKNVARDGSGRMAWSAVGVGVIDWQGQFAALRRAGYRGAVSLETHWRGGGTAEASSLSSWAGMKTALVAADCL
jgi:sugar phosphate isomerase/epimerase